jgi:alpha-amylase/alpha-mannosidase (GH57 family)
MEMKETSGNDVHQARIIIAKENNEYIKIIFLYPESTRPTIKRGYVKQVFDNGFLFDEIIDGLMSYSYSYISEIKGEEKR